MKKYLALLSLSLMTGLALCDKQPLVKIDEAPVSQPASQPTLDEQKTKEFAVKIQEILKNNTGIIQQYISQNNANATSHETLKQINMSLKGINFSLSAASLYYLGQSCKSHF